jgi:nitroreductase
METLKAIAARRSIRTFRSGATIPPEQLVQIVDAGRLAPTARNEQPWEFVVLTEREALRDLGALCDHGRFIADASACVVVLAAPTKYYVEDGSAATTQMLLAAADLGLAGCWVAGDKKAYGPEVVRLVGAPPELKLVALVALGYGTDTPGAPKRALEEVLHWNGFGRRRPT